MENTNEIQLNQNLTPVKKPRNASFEILRIICMVLIISTHFLGHGGWIHNMTEANLVFGKLLQSLFYPAVNLYVMIGAYFMCNSKSTKVNLKKLAKLCGTVLFYSLLLFVISVSTGMYKFDVNHLLSSIFPLITGKYWFFTSYVVLLIASPFLNIIIRGVNTKQLACICAVFIVAGGIQAETGVLPQFPLAGGCNGIWFVGVYFIAALIRRTDFKFTKTTGIIAILLYLGTLVYGYFVHTSYSSFMCVLSTVIIFVFFKDLKVKDGMFSKIACTVSPLTFGVYLIHDSNEMRGYMYQNIFHAYKFYDHQVAFLILVGFILLTFVVCATFEFGRHKIAQLLSPSVNKLLDNLGNKIKAKVETYKAKKLAQ
jgi:hypothetical protein